MTTEATYSDYDAIPADAELVGIVLTRPDVDPPESRRLDFDDLTPADDRAATRWLGQTVAAQELIGAGGPLAVAFTWWLAGKKAGITEQPRKIQQMFTARTVREWDAEFVVRLADSDDDDPTGEHADPPA